MRSEPLLRATLLTQHNAVRRNHGVAPMAWSDALARDAERQAQSLALSGRYGHDPALANANEGETLWMGTRSAYSYQQIVGSMIDEGRYFRPGRFPYVSRTGRWSDTGHFSQMVWPQTSRVGCAMASNASDDVLVCRYWPAGNVVGGFVS